MANTMLEQLYSIQTKNPPSLVRLPAGETVYDIDLDSREINSPKFLSVKKDHKSETIYFRVDRFYDYVDLSTTVCLIQYITPISKKSRFYVVPFFDIATQRETSKMLIPWCIDGAATSEVGDVEYSIRFYRVAEIEQKIKLVYNFNTLPSKSKVLYTLDIQADDPEIYDIDATVYEEIMAKIDSINRVGTYWTILD